VKRLLDGSFLCSNNLLLSKSSKHGDLKILSSIKIGSDLVSQFTSGHFEIVLGDSGSWVHKRAVTVSRNIDELVVSSSDVGDIHVVSRRGQIFVLLASEDVDTNHVDFGVSVLTGLGSAHFHNFAWVPLDDNVASLSQSRALLWVGLGSSRVCLAFKFFISHR